MTVPFQLPNASTITSALSKVPSLPCGLNIKLDGLEALQKKFDAAIGEITAGVNGVFDKINDLKSQLESNLNACINQLRSILSDMKIPSLEFPIELMKALSLLRTDATAFLNAIADLKIKFPSIDIDGILNKLFSDINFNFCKMVPNVKIIDGVEVTKAIPEVKPDKSPDKLPTPATGPAVKPPAMPKRLGVITDSLKLELDGYVKAGDVTKVNQWWQQVKQTLRDIKFKEFRLNPDTDHWIPTGKRTISEWNEEEGLAMTLAITARQQIIAEQENILGATINIYKHGKLADSVAPDINVEP